MLRFRVFLAVGFLATLPACAIPQQSRIDREIRAMEVHDADMDPPTAVDIRPAPEAARSVHLEAPGATFSAGARKLPEGPAFGPSAEANGRRAQGGAAKVSAGSTRADRSVAHEESTAADRSAALRRENFQRESPPAAPEPLRRTLKIPDALPGANAPGVRLPRSPTERERALNEVYPPLPPLPTETPAAPGPEGKPLSLTDLQRLGETYSPAIKAAIAAVETAKGNALQAGAYPNPTVAWEHDTAESGSGYPGGYIDQVIVTGGKLKLKQAAATMDVLNAKLALARARSDLRTQVRSNYFAHLVAYENTKITDALLRFTEEIYQAQLDLLDKGLAAAYEPMQLRAAVQQARVNRMQAGNQYQASWRKLAATLGVMKMPLSEVEGRVDLPIPTYEYAEIRARVDRHTDVRSAINAVQKARYNLDLARATPIPNIKLQFLVQKDYTTPPFQIAESTRASISLPAWDQNKGAIHQAKWQLSQAAVGVDRARNALLIRLADAFQRYQTGLRNVEVAASQIKDQVRGYRSLYERRQQAPGDVAFADLVGAQQTLATYITSYIAALGLQWQAAVDLAGILQEDNLFQVGRKYEVTPIPDLSMLSPPVILKRGRKGCVSQSLPRPAGENAPIPWEGAQRDATPPRAGTVGRRNAAAVQSSPSAGAPLIKERPREIGSPDDVPIAYRREPWPAIQNPSASGGGDPRGMK